MHTISTRMGHNDGLDTIVGYDVMFVQQVAVGHVVHFEKTLVRGFGYNEWDFNQACDLCQKLNGGTPDHNALDTLEAVLNSVLPMVEKASILFTMAYPKMEQELQNG
jgi:hypothetical protein